MTAPWKRSIGIRFSLLTILLVTGISLTFFVLEAALSYKREMDRLNHELLQIRESHVPALISSLWLTDYPLLQLQIDAISRFPYIDRVEVMTDDGAVYHSGVEKTELLRRIAEPLTYTRRDTAFEVGRLDLYINQQDLRGAAFRILAVSFSGHIAAVIAVAFAVSILFRRQVGRPIQSLEAALQSDDHNDLYSPLRLPRRKEYPDELNFLIGAINLMRSKLHRHLQEREILLAEVHHRIKNDMNFVKALLMLQAEQSGLPEVHQAIREASQRVSVMARMYERLYCDTDFREVSLRPFAQQVAGDFLALGVLPPDSIRLTSEELSVPTKLSLSIGIILNELLTNAVKYAFAPGSEPQITFDIRRNSESGAVEITVADNGRGIPQDVSEGKIRGYGLTIVNSLVRQHKGTLELENSNGTRIRITLSTG